MPRGLLAAVGISVVGIVGTYLPVLMFPTQSSMEKRLGHRGSVDGADS